MNIIKLFETIREKSQGKELTIIEAGCYDGADTKDLSKYFPESKIYAFEPIPKLYSNSVENTKNCPNVKIFEFALGERKEKQEMYLSMIDDGIWGSSSLYKPKEHLIQHPNVTFPEKVLVDVINLNDWCDENNIEKIDFMWLDLQGYEYKVLNTLSQKRLDELSYILVEVCFIELYENAEKFNIINEFLNKNGFVVHTHENYNTTTGNMTGVKDGNYFYVKNNRL